MSLFLGPIHYMLYEKIKYQDELSNKLLEKAVDKTKKEINQKCFKLTDGKLEDIIDNQNIHEWLNNQVNNVENKFALIIEKLVEEQKHNQIVDIMFQEGEKVSEGKKYIDCTEVFNIINSYLLDGMPCDKGVAIISKEGNEIIFEYNKDVHLAFKDFAKYIEIRIEWIRGLLSNTPSINIISLSDISLKLKKEES